MGYIKIDDTTRGAPLEMRAVYALVMSYKDKGCFLTNQQVADELGITYRKANTVINILTDAKVISATYYDGKKRKMSIARDFANTQNQFCEITKSILQKRKINFADLQGNFAETQNRFCENAKSYNKEEEIQVRNTIRITGENTRAQSSSIENENFQSPADEPTPEYFVFLQGWCRSFQVLKKTDFLIPSGTFQKQALELLAICKADLFAADLPLTADSVADYFCALYDVADSWQQANWGVPVITKQINKFHAAINKRRDELAAARQTINNLGF